MADSPQRRSYARRGNQRELSVEDAKRMVLDRIAAGDKVAQAAAAAGRAVETYRDWMKNDPEFKAEVKRLRERRAAGDVERADIPDFPEFCRDYLHEPLFEHQLRAWDALNGREPRNLHPSMTWEQGEPTRVLLNFPPNHCPAVDTLVPTTRGLIPAGDVRVGDFAFDMQGDPTEVLESVRCEPNAPQFRVTFNTGDSFDVDASHLWFARDLTKGDCLDGPMLTQYRTDQLYSLGVLTGSGQRRWRIDNAQAVQHEEKDLPLDPYLFGYWLGDGDTHGSRFAVSVGDVENLEANLASAGFSFRRSPQLGGFEVYAHKMRHLLPLGEKVIPVEYMTGSKAQRLALLQGLMDSDGTITAKDSRARFVQAADLRQGLADQVYELAASLGLQPRMKWYVTNGCRTAEVSFRASDDPVFRLERKASRQKPLHKAHSTRRTIVSIEPLDILRPIQQITVAAPDCSMLLGRGHVVSHNAKTTSFSINYVVWRIHKDPNVKVAIISKSQGFAKKVLAAVKMRLTSNAYRDMHAAFGPVDGWRDPDQSWSATQIYVQGKGDGEKDPTVEAVGLGGQIYGGRFDVIICDDVVDNENAHRWQDQIDWLMTILDSRLPPDGGLMLVLGTRIASTDLYGELRKRTDEDDNQFFTYLAQPAVLDYGDGDKLSWVPLWPYTNAQDGETRDDPHERCLTCFAASPCGCESPYPILMKTRWDGKRLAKKRFPLGERRWSLVWQQQQIPDDATFNQFAVNASINRSRQPGPLTVGAMGHRQAGMSGLYVIGGLDPATVGNTAMMICGFDRAVEKRYLMDGFNQANCSPATMRQQIITFTDRYKVNEWVIERNAFQRFLTQDPQLRAALQSRGCRLTEHYTTSNKVDPDFGVMSLAPLFESCGEPPSNGGGGNWKRTPDKALIELPNDRQSAVFTELVKQLIMWEPSGLAQSTKTDLVMALWFTEIAVQRILGRSRQTKTHLDNPFASRARLKERAVINLAQWREQQLQEREAM